MRMDMEAFMPLITEASQAKTLAFEALSFAKEKDAQTYEELVSKSKKHLIAAHKKQTQLLSLNSGEQQAEINIYVIHAMDHVANAQMIYQMTQELAELHLKREN